MKIEQWKICDECDNYQISNFGRAQRIDSQKILKPSNVDGYLQIKLCKNGVVRSRKLHILVAKLFVPNPDKKTRVNHIDGNKSNANATNLEWCTSKENIAHAYATGLMNCMIGERNSASKIKDSEVENIKRLYTEGYLQREIASIYNVSKHTIHYILANKRYLCRNKT